MKIHADQHQKSTEFAGRHQRQKLANTNAQNHESQASAFQIENSGPEAVTQRKPQVAVDNRARAKELNALQIKADNSIHAQKAMQLQAMSDRYTARHYPSTNSTGDDSIQRVNNTGLPDTLKTGMENLSGLSLDDVKVHRNSAKPAQLQAHAYAQGTDIHLGPGQEKHLPHEVWHVVQQKQGRVKPTMQMKGKVSINDNAGLEKEADVMGAKSLAQTNQNNVQINQTKVNSSTIQRKLMTEAEFKKASGSAFSGKRNNILKVDDALYQVEGALSRSMALSNLIVQCNDYLNSPNKKAKKRVAGVNALLINAKAELQNWYKRSLPDRPDYVYRLEKDAPEVIAASGFKSTGQDDSDVTIIEHVNNSLASKRAPMQGRNPKYDPGTGEIGTNAKSHTHWISTGGSLEFMRDPTLMQGIMEKRVYKIDTRFNPESFVDASKVFNEQQVPNPYEMQLEFAQEGGIPPAWVTHYVEAREFIPIILGEKGASFDQINWRRMP